MMQWKKAEIAQGAAATREKCFTANCDPKPEFCIPTSIEKVRRSRSPSLKNRAHP